MTHLKPTSKLPTLTSCLDSCRRLLVRLEKVRTGILAEFRDKLNEHEHLLELAVNEAEALAWQTEFPQLIFPTLAAEKARAVADWKSNQQRVKRMPLALCAA